MRKLFLPILKLFESGTEPFVYKSSHRVILVVMGFLFTALATGLAILVFMFVQDEEWGYFLPVLVFGGSGLLSLLVGFMGSDRGVAKIWGSK